MSVSDPVAIYKQGNGIELKTDAGTNASLVSVGCEKQAAGHAQERSGVVSMCPVGGKREERGLPEATWSWTAGDSHSRWEKMQEGVTASTGVRC